MRSFQITEAFLALKTESNGSGLSFSRVDRSLEGTKAVWQMKVAHDFGIEVSEQIRDGPEALLRTNEVYESVEDLIRYLHLMSPTAPWPSHSHLCSHIGDLSSDQTKKLLSVLLDGEPFRFCRDRNTSTFISRDEANSQRL